MSLPITTHRATIEHAGEIVLMVDALLREIMSSTQHQAFDFDIEKTTAILRQLFEENQYFVFIARDTDGHLVGCITMEESHALYADGTCGTLREFFIRPERRSQGIGLKLLEEAKAFGRLRGWTRLEVTTPPLPQFEKTLEFYEREGFSITGGRKLKLAL